MASKYYNSSGKEVEDGNVALASDLNTINSAIDSGFQLVVTDMEAVVTDAEFHANSAETSATEAASSASAAATSASNAASSASAASTSASNSSSSASSASSSASAASTSASQAATSATNAANSATTATTKASEAATSATNAAASLTTLQNSKDTSNGIAGLTLLKINFMNALGTVKSFFTNSNTSARTYTFQDRNGTIADDTDLALKAPIDSPVFTTSAKGPTPGNTDDSTNFATTAWVKNVITGSNGASGYHKLPNGLVIQWGSATCHPSTIGQEVFVAYPIAFGSVYSITVTPNFPGTTVVTAWWSNNVNSGFSVRGSQLSLVVSWIAIGFITPS